MQGPSPLSLSINGSSAVRGSSPGEVTDTDGPLLQSQGTEGDVAADKNDDDEEEEDLYPMENFSLVASGIYRASFPKRRNFPFLQKLRLKSILTLILEDYPDLNTKFLDENGIKLFQFGVAGNKEPFVDIPEDKVGHDVEFTKLFVH